MKKIINIIPIILLIFLFKLACSFTINEIIIKNYNNGLYNSALIKTLYTFNFNQPYIVYYNEGNILYKKENYYEAIEQYNKALGKKPPHKKACDIRINLTLATIKTINSNEYKTIYNDLEDAKNILYENNCASPTDNSGYSQDAEKLEEEIKELQKQLNNNSNNNSNNSQENEENEENENEENYEDIEKQLKEIEKKANANRQSDLSTYENLGEFSHYSGKKW